LRVPLLNLGIGFKILDGEDRPHKARGKAWVNFFKRESATKQAATPDHETPGVDDIIFDAGEIF
jgi:hypothetical protein